MTLSISPSGADSAGDHDPHHHPVARIAHRAGNDRAALRQAIDAGVDWVEIDLWYSYGQLLARHERGVWRLPLVYDKWRVRLLRESLIDLAELVRMTDGGPRLFIDLKGTNRRLPSAIVDLLRHFNAVDRAAVCGQHWPPLDAIARAEPAIQIFHSLGRPEHVEAFRSRRQNEPGSSGVSVARNLLTPELVQTWDRQGLQVFAWTVNEPSLASQLASWGVHGIISDRLDLLAGLP